jgi:two-component system nitrogen regulation response regulator NtrX
MPTKRILILDDEENICRSLRMILEREGYQVRHALSAATFQQVFRSAGGRADAYLLDVRLPDGSGIDVLKQIRQADPSAAALMISGQATIADAVEATRAGAYDFLEKPLSREKVLLALKNALEQSSLRAENERLRELVGTSEMIGRSPAFLAAVEQATRAALSDARILLYGESGTGKELLASHIHHASRFASGPFIKVNCAAIPTELMESELFGHEKGAFTGASALRRGKFELADGGTLFLDEVGDLPLAAQAKLLRVLQEGEFHRVGSEQPIRVSVRVVSATNHDLAEMSRRQEFREDLYYRLCVMPIRVPPLRERVDDIPLLAEYFLTDFCRRNNFRPKTIDPDLLPCLCAYSWPGNVRELRNTVERMAILSSGDLLTLDVAPLELRAAQEDRFGRSVLRETREAAEREQLRRALEAAGWNVSSAARALGVERTSLHKRMKALGLAREG